MIIDSPGTTIVGGLSLAGGTPFQPIDDESAFSVYELESGMGVGVVLNNGALRPYLLFYPSLQLPPFARDERSWRRWSFCDADDRTASLNMDAEDGEIRFTVNDVPRDVIAVEERIEEGLSFLESLRPRLLGYVRDQWRREGSAPACR